MAGGIQRYMEAFPSSDSLFQGSLFVFDERVSVAGECIWAELTLRDMMIRMQSCASC